MLCREPVGARWICRGGSRSSAEGTESPSEVVGGGAAPACWAMLMRLSGAAWRCGLGSWRAPPPESMLRKGAPPTSWVGCELTCVCAIRSMMAPLPRGCGHRGRRTARVMGGVVLIEFGVMETEGPSGDRLVVCWAA